MIWLLCLCHFLLFSHCGQLCCNHCESLYVPSTPRHAVVCLLSPPRTGSLLLYPENLNKTLGINILLYFTRKSDFCCLVAKNEPKAYFMLSCWINELPVTLTQHLSHLLRFAAGRLNSSSQITRLESSYNRLTEFPRLCLHVCSMCFRGRPINRSAD